MTRLEFKVDLMHDFDTANKIAIINYYLFVKDSYVTFSTNMELNNESSESILSLLHSIHRRGCNIHEMYLWQFKM